MTLTDAQLGRIARAASDNLLDARDVGVIVDYANKGDLADAIRWVRCSPGLISVLREVAAEVAENEQKRRDVCRLRWEEDASDACEVEVAGRAVLREALSLVRCSDPKRITITNEHHGVEWTWMREAER